MAYVCAQLQESDGVKTCALWVEQVTVNDFLAITPHQAAEIGTAACLVIIVAAAFNKLSHIGDKSNG
ncbi:hypothetical protein [Acinetobacter gyllenbergii]|uniref:hypothetical protein n=1 Tax=Acinetobacter gyllenbergii TaxID=134534 RepID=UPI000806DEEB|nr:hypothetical protein [Acinetobacter gyllenbergii]OBY72369.1 hypothetical protein NG55_20280 [Acinetobacter gyllenbergii]